MTKFFLVFVTIWALVATTLLIRKNYWSERQRIESESSFEELSFLKQFISQYFTYDSENFWQTQTALANLMTEELKERRLREITLLNQRTGTKRFLQNVDILSIREKAEDLFDAEVKVTSFEEQKKTEILVRMTLEIESHPSSDEVPWGFKMKSLNVSSLSAVSPTSGVSEAIAVMPKKAITLVFPCAVENVTGVAAEIWKHRIITSHTSEVQLTLLAPITQQNLTFNCQEKSFQLKFESLGSFPTDLYRSIPISAGAKRIQNRNPDIVPKADRKTIENELNFIFSE